MNTCSIRTHDGCTCSTRCKAQPEPLQAPVFIPTWKQQLAVFVFGVVVMAFASFGALALSEPQLKAAALDCQEACRVVTR